MSKKASVAYSVQATSTAAIFVPANPRRHTLHVSPPIAGAALIAFGMTATLTNGFVVPAGTSGRTFDVETYGEQLQDFVSVILTVPGPATITAIDVSYAI